MTKLTKLFEPGKIGKLRIPNRVVMPAMGSQTAEIDGFVNQRTIKFYEVRCAGEVGLIISQATSMHPRLPVPYRLRVYDDKYIPGLRELCQAVHKYETKIACQLAHFGPQLAFHQGEFEFDADLVGPSAVPVATFGKVPRALTLAEIQDIIEAYGSAARRAQEAEFDAVEIHSAHGFLLSAFRSPYTNRRTDKYGGNVEDRARLICEVVARVRKSVGPDFPIILRINGSDYFEGGTTLKDTLRQVPLFIKAGVDALNISGAFQESREFRDTIYYYPPGVFVADAAAVKKVSTVPVITCGKIGDAVFADQVLRDGKADFTAMGRALLADPELPKKAREGRFADIKKCLYCNNCRVGFGTAHRIQARGSGLACTVNPMVGREIDFIVKPAKVRKNVMVAGGGPAGIVAATMAARRGHKVTLYEKAENLGGQWSVAALFKEKNHFQDYLDQLAREMKEAGVKVKLNTEVTPELVKKTKPDALVVATGSVQFLVPIPGIDGKNVIQATDILKGKGKVGKRVVVIGGRLIGMEIAEMLARQGKKVSLVTKARLGENGRRLERNTFVTLRKRLVEAGVFIYPFSPVTKISPKGVTFLWDGELAFEPADTVILAVGVKADNALAQDAQGLVKEMYTVGDCVEPRDGRDAVNEGAEAGLKV